MTTEQKIEQIYQRVLRIEQANRPRSTWVSVSFITLLTGWNREQMRKAREQGIIEYRENKTGGLEYKVESIPEQFLLKKTA